MQFQLRVLSLFVSMSGVLFSSNSGAAAFQPIQPSGIHEFFSAAEVSAIQAQEPLQSSPAALEQQGIVSFEEGNFEDAVRYLSLAQKADPSNPVLAAALGQAYLSAKDPSHAIGPLTSALSVEPENEAVRLALAQSYQRLNRDDNVLQLLGHRAGERPHSPLYSFTLAFSEFRLGQYEKAETGFRQLLIAKNMEAAASFFIANCRFGQNDLEGSLSWYNSAIHLAESQRVIALNAYYYNYGLALFRLGKYVDANSAFRASADLDARDPLPPYFVGRSQVKSGQVQDAIATFTQLVQIHPDFSPAYYQMGILYSRGGDKRHAQAMFSKVKEIKNAELDEQRLLGTMKSGADQVGGIGVPSP